MKALPKILLGLTGVAALSLAYPAWVQAVPTTYHYTGNPFTEGARRLHHERLRDGNGDVGGPPGSEHAAHTGQSAVAPVIEGEDRGGAPVHLYGPGDDFTVSISCEASGSGLTAPGLAEVASWRSTTRPATSDEIFLCHFLDDSRWDDCRFNAGAGERHDGAQPRFSRWALH